MTPWMDSTFTPLVGFNYYCAPYGQNERFGNQVVRVTKLILDYFNVQAVF